MIRASSLIFVLVLASFFAEATHIVGGSLTYDHLGGSTYRIKLKLYRDCNGVPYPSNVNIQVFLQDGSSWGNINIPFPGAINLNPPIDTCAFNPGVCVQEAVYTKIVNNLPPQPGGYHLYWQTCCRNCSLSNLTNPCGWMNGATYYTKIPDNTQIITNSSPEWVNFPPVFVCVNQPLVFDHSATDSDGDSLVYSLIHPDSRPGYTVGYPFFTFPQVTYAPGYWEESPLEPNINPTMFIDSQTGILTTTPSQLGQFVVGVQVLEYRNDTIIGRTRRDFQFNVLNCPPPANAGIGPVVACYGQTVCFQNASDSAANNFFWDFGDLSTTTDTSSAYEPCYTYPGIGPYTVTLIAQYGTNCADTDTVTFEISWAQADFNSVDSVCIGTPVIFSDASTSSGNSNISSWSWDFGDSTYSTIPSPTHTYSSSGTKTVMLIVVNTLGCVDTIYKNIYVQPMPVADAGNDTIACTNNPTVTLNGQVYGASGGYWVGGAGSFTPNQFTLNADYTPTNGEILTGYVVLILTTTGNGFCPSAVDTVVISFVPGPNVQAGPDIIVCKDTSGVPLSGNVTIATGGTWSTTGDGGFFPDPDSLNAIYIPGTNDTTIGSVMIILTSTGNGNCLPNSDTLYIFFTDLPVVTATANDTACAGSYIPVNATSTTGSGIWSTLGGGSFLPSDTLLSTTYLPDITDDTSGYVVLVFTSTNNGGCQPQTDTVYINLIPSPNAAFNVDDVCLHDSAFFNDLTTTIGNIVSWNWDFGDGNSSIVKNPSNLYDTTGTYSVTLIVASDNGCIDTVVQQVIVYDLPVADFINNGVCLNEMTQFFDTSSVMGGIISTWSWDFGDGSHDSIENPTHSYGSDGSYLVTLIVTSDKGCKDTVVKAVTVSPLPTADFTIDETPANVSQVIHFFDASVTGTSWYWDFGDSTTSTLQFPDHSYSEPGIYTVMLVITDDNGCVDTIYKDVIIAVPPLVPSGFTPNGDGQNDVLYVRGGNFTELEFKIYNNWGELIFVSNNQADGWDGTRNAIEQPIGVYVYTVNGVTEDGVKHELSGDVTLLR